MTLKVIDGGMHSTIQDDGRTGYIEFGFAPSGALDIDSFYFSHLLLDNECSSSVIEMIAVGGSFLFTKATTIALTGSDCSPLLNGKPVSLYKTILIEAGDELVCGPMKDGMLTYLAVQGGFHIKKVMGSTSTHTRIKIGGIEGRPLKAGDELGFDKKEKGSIPRWLNPQYLLKKSNQFIRVIEGPQLDEFSSTEKQAFFSSEYRISSNSDRMGYRLNGEKLTSDLSKGMISEGTVLGAVQVPSNGQPIVLLNDRQTTGGYPVIATVCTADIPKLVQIPIGQFIRFKKISVKEAQEALRMKNQRKRIIKENLQKQDMFHQIFSAEKKSELNQLLDASSFHYFEYQDSQISMKKGEGNSDNDYD